MPTFVLVHGGSISPETWNRYTSKDPVRIEDGNLGGRCWDGTVSFLKTHHYPAFAVDLHDEHKSSLLDHIMQVSDLITRNNLIDLILVAHSYGGVVITGVAAGMPERILHMVYIDAALPDPGQSLFDLLFMAGIDPLSIPGLEPARPYTQRLQFDPAALRAIPKTYILCTKSDFAPLTRLAYNTITAAPKGWTYHELPSSHLPMAEMPEVLNKLILEIADEGM